jgi:hypothetical protein
MHVLAATNHLLFFEAAVPVIPVLFLSYVFQAKGFDRLRMRRWPWYRLLLPVFIGALLVRAEVYSLLVLYRGHASDEATFDVALGLGLAAALALSPIAADLAVHVEAWVRKKSWVQVAFFLLGSAALIMLTLARSVF